MHYIKNVNEIFSNDSEFKHQEKFRVGLKLYNSEIKGQI